jgi:hypothetical protein
VAHPEATEALERQIAALGEQAIGIAADVSRPHGYITATTIFADGGIMQSSPGLCMIPPH